ncbi:MAG: Gfo/Idh/MocA family oxidoreductase [Armatimonadota bacterium]|nr:MAG: Gfo/Idh/MocA family oxidoreductase [Armatimonadota bacterium]
MTEDKKITRRDFLRQSAIAAAAAGMYSMASPNALGANDRLNFGVIGCGGRGTGLLQDLVNRSKNADANMKVVAVCDIYEPRKERAKGICGGELFHEYTDLLAMDDLDAVVIGTPDHWHARMSIDAMNAGKDVYCEKPMTLYWDEAKEVARVQAMTGRVMQVGAQSASDDRFWKANEVIRQGGVGKLLWTQGGSNRNSREGEWNWWIDPAASPDNLDWKRFLGSAPERPFDPERFFRFRKYWDYSGGIATDLFYHSLAHLQIALTPEFPKRVSAGGGIFAFHDREVPDTYHTIIDYPTHHTVVLTSSMANRQGVEDIIRGHEATLYFRGRGVVVEPENEYKDERQGLEVPSEPRPDHMTNWLECVRSRKQPHLDAQAGYKVMVAIALGVKAYRENTVVQFDPEKERIVS